MWKTAQMDPLPQITELKVWHGLWQWNKEGEGVVMERLTFPVKQTMHNFKVTFTSTQCEYVRAVLRGVYLLLVMLWWQKKKKRKTQDMKVMASTWWHLCLSILNFMIKFICLICYHTGWEVMDIQRTRTAPETGTGRQFDTMQRHLITAVADKTQSVLFVSNYRNHEGPCLCSHIAILCIVSKQFNKHGMVFILLSVGF